MKNVQNKIGSLSNALNDLNNLEDRLVKTDTMDERVNHMINELKIQVRANLVNTIDSMANIQEDEPIATEQSDTGELPALHKGALIAFENNHYEEGKPEAPKRKLVVSIADVCNYVDRLPISSMVTARTIAREMNADLTTVTSLLLSSTFMVYASIAEVDIKVENETVYVVKA